MLPEGEVQQISGPWWRSREKRLEGSEEAPLWLPKTAASGHYQAAVQDFAP